MCCNSTPIILSMTFIFRSCGHVIFDIEFWQTGCFCHAFYYRSNDLLRSVVSDVFPFCLRNSYEVDISMALVTIQRSPTPSLPLEESLSDVGNCSSEASIVTTERQTPQGSSWYVIIFFLVIGMCAQLFRVLRYFRIKCV
ncbi:hypothetical protein D918_05549 [Trichuris suis]|nr:hypothetical protein D918_05549 [Trichuris suis]